MRHQTVLTIVKINLLLLLLLSILPSTSYSGEFEAIDLYASTTPPAIEVSVKSLAKFLTAPAENDREIARAIFVWISSHIVYDTSMIGGESTSFDASQDPFESRKSLCGGFSSLFERLAEAAGLEAVTIDGFSRGYGYRVGEKTEGSSNHAWNAVKIDDEWKLLDVTWGSGYVDEKGTYVQKFEEHYFFTPAQELILTHFPSDPSWQLLSAPLSLEQFNSAPFVKPDFFRNRLNFLSHPKADIAASRRFMVELSAPPGVILTSELYDEGMALYPGRTFSQRSEGIYEIHVSPPGPGSYTLRIYAKPSGGAGLFEWALDYHIVFSEKLPDDPPFPDTYKDFLVHNCYLKTPLNGILQHRDRIKFSITVPDATEVMVLSGAKRTFLKSRGELYEGIVEITGDEIKIFGKFSAGNRFSALLEYRVVKKSKKKPS